MVFNGTHGVASILLIDDDEVFAGQLSRLLESAGHKVTALAKGGSAIETLHAGGHQLLILDIMLPDVSGFELCRRIRRDAAFFAMPIVMLSSMSSDEEVLHGLAQGADDYVTKPCEPNGLLLRVNALLRLASEDNTTDALTSLPSGDHAKRELQRRMASPEPFALVYFELMALREFSFRSGHEARGKAIRHLGRALRKVGKFVFDAEPFVGHMGGGHFVSFVDAAKAFEFGEKLRAAWLNHLEEFYRAIGEEEAYANAKQADGADLLDVLVCITRRDPKAAVTPKTMLETVSQIRQRALTSRQPGVYMDQREFGGP
jgi:DNA-binding response OmpR family regulator